MTRSSRLSRRAVSSLALAGALMASLGTTSAHAEPQGEITVLGFGGVFVDNFTKSVVAPFEAAYPGIKVNLQPSKNSSESLALLRAQKDDPTVDVALMDVNVAYRANAEGLYQPLDATIVENLAELHDWARYEGDLGAAVTQDSLVFIYNTNELSEAPQSWDALLDPALKGRIGLGIADTRGILALVALSQKLGVDYKESIDPAIEFLKSASENVLTWDPAPNVLTAVESGQIALSLSWNSYGQASHISSNGALAVSRPVEGTGAQINTINLVAGSQNAEAAQLFINYALSAEAQKTLAELSYYAPTNRTVEISEEARPLVLGEAEVYARTAQIDWAWLPEQFSDWVQRIKREVIGG